MCIRDRDEWHTLCAAIAGLPYFKELFLDSEKEQS